MHPTPELLHRYKRFRQASLRLNQRLIKLLPRDAITTTADRLGMLQCGVLLLETEDESSVLMDQCLNTYRWNGKTAFEHFLEVNAAEITSDEESLLEASMLARFSIFKVSSISRGYGATMEDLLHGDSFFLIDLGLSGTASIGGTLACRIIRPGPDLSMSTGAALPVFREAGDRMIRDMKRHLPAALRGVEKLSREESDRFSFLVIKALLASGSSEQIAYQSTFESSPGSPPATVHSQNGISRNASCPCGSGRRYKRCCGKRKRTP
jgi:hypothetical protein